MIRSQLAHDFMLSPNVGARGNGFRVSILLLHYTGMKSAEAARDWLCNPASKVSCHYLIDEQGRITQMVDEGLRAWHAGYSHWKGVEDINSASVGIEIQNGGHMLGYTPFPGQQMWAVIALCKDILSRHEIMPSNVLAHSDVAPLRKIDPGEKFDWRQLHAHGIGHWVEAADDYTLATVRMGDRGGDVMRLQQQLNQYGYGIQCDGIFGKETLAVVQAFQRHFRTACVDGVADGATVKTLQQLLETV
jgi:N-acetylmuramoyl-L-alanine amidase